MGHEAVLKAIRISNCSQTTFAERIGSNLDMVNSWINRGIQIPIHYAVAIECLTKGEVTWKEVSPHLAHFEKLWEGLRLIPQFSPLKNLQIPLSQIQYEVTASQEEMDDIQNLAEHIKRFGLQYPIGIDTEKRLMFGRKRLLAYQLLGKETIECWSVSLPDLLAGQYAPEVLCHYFRFSERLQVSFALKKWIGNRQGQRKNKSLRQEYAEVKVKGRSDDLIAKCLGFGKSRLICTH
jgi:DNA-binding transcriptional regulator YdaS (Cro superfamily)